MHHWKIIVCSRLKCCVSPPYKSFSDRRVWALYQDPPPSPRAWHRWYQKNPPPRRPASKSCPGFPRYLNTALRERARDRRRERELHYVTLILFILYYCFNYIFRSSCCRFVNSGLTSSYCIYEVRDETVNFSQNVGLLNVFWSSILQSGLVESEVRVTGIFIGECFYGFERSHINLKFWGALSTFMLISVAQTAPKCVHCCRALWVSPLGLLWLCIRLSESLSVVYYSDFHWSESNIKSSTAQVVL